MKDPVIPATALLAYVISIVGIKAFMASRQPYELKWFLLVYNFVQVVASFYIFAEILIVAWQSKYSLTCETVDYSDDPLALRVTQTPIMDIFFH